MTTYDPQAVFAVIRSDWIAIFACLGIAMIGNTLYFVEAVRLGFRDRSYANSAACTLFFLAHDLSFILNFERWFREYDFWVWKALWVNILISVAGEIIVLYQMLKYSRQEVLPGFSLGAATAAVVLAAGGAFVAFSYVLTLIGDPLYIMTMPFTIFWLAPFAISLTLRRRSQRGQSVLLNASYIVMVIGMWPAWWQLGVPFFRTPMFLALGAVTILWSLANIWVLRRQPAFDGPAHSPLAQATHRPQDRHQRAKAVPS
jgi:hypothetical protein